MDYIKVHGARENNLQNIDIDIPKNKLVVMTGISGSGKSSLAFDTLYQEGQRRYMESLSAYARQFLGNFEKPDVDRIEGLSPSISIDQKTTSNNPRSTVGTVTEIYDYLRLLYARVGIPYCPGSDEPLAKQSIEEMTVRVLNLKEGTYSTSFQSRLGRDPWLQPYTDKTIDNFAQNGIKNLAVVTPAFVSDCLETLEEIGMEAKESFEENGGEHFSTIPCLNDDDAWVKTVADWINNWAK